MESMLVFLALWMFKFLGAKGGTRHLIHSTEMLFFDKELSRGGVSRPSLVGLQNLDLLIYILFVSSA